MVIKYTNKAPQTWIDDFTDVIARGNGVQPNPTTYKVCIIGDAGVGKTVMVRKFLTNDFTNQYLPTIGVEVHPFHFNTNVGAITLNFWDCAGNPKFAGIKEGYYHGADAAIIMFDVKRYSAERIAYWKAKFTNKYVQDHPGKQAPIVVVGNKDDEGIANVPHDVDLTMSVANGNNCLRTLEVLLSVTRGEEVVIN